MNGPLELILRYLHKIFILNQWDSLYQWNTKITNLLGPGSKSNECRIHKDILANYIIEQGLFWKSISISLWVRTDKRDQIISFNRQRSLSLNNLDE